MKNKIISKVLAMGLAGTLALLSPASFTVFAEGYDTTAPVVTDIFLDKDTAEPGDTITLDMNVSEDETGISYMYLVINGEVVNAAITPDGSAVSGKYTVSYTIPEDAKPGEYHIDDIFCKDIAGNESHNADFYSKTFTVTNKNYIEDQAPVLEDSYPESETLEVPGTQVIDVICHDDDLASISIDTQWTSEYTSSTEFNKHVDFTVSDISEDGVYKVEIPYTDNLISGTFNYSIDLTDKAGNTSNCIGKIFKVVNTTEEPDIDVAPPVVTSITTDTKDPITLPGVGSITISGTEDKASSVSGYVTIGNTEATGTSLYVNFTAPVVDSKWSATETFSLDQNAKAGIYKTLWMSVTDANNCTYSTEALPCSWSVVHESEDIAIETTLNNPNLTYTLKNMDEGQTAVVRTTTNVAPAEVFEAIKGEDKNVVFDEDGIQWVFNGQNISDENIKDVDLSVDIENSEDLTDLGYEEGSTGTILDFAPNGVLPGKCVVRLKSDYISDKYNLDSELYLACIRKTVEYQEEIKYTDFEWPTDKDGNPIYETTSYVYDENGAIEYENKLLYDEDGNPIYEALKDEQGNTLVDNNGNTLYSSEQAYEKVPKTITTRVEPKLVEKIKYVNESKEQQVQIEDVGIKIDSNGFINITMTHNSSYVLSADLPKVIVDNTNNNDKNNINNSQNSNTNESINSDKNTTYDIRSTAPTTDSKDNGSVIRSTNNDDVNGIHISSSDNNKRSISTDPKSIESVKSPITGDSNNPLYATIFVALIGGLLLVINTSKF